MKSTETGELMSPLHDVSLEPTSDEIYHITGVIKSTSNTNKKLEINKELAYDPIMQAIIMD